MKHSFVFSIVSFVAGALLTFAFLPRHSPIAIENKKFEELKDKFQQIHDDDFQDYLSLREHREKYLKANEILGKIMVLFLAELGLRISNDDIVKMKEVLEIPLTESDFAVAKNGDASVSAAPECGFSNRGAGGTAGGQSSAIAENQDPQEWKKFEQSLTNPKSESEIKDFLKKVAIKDLFSEIKSAKNAPLATLEKMLGIFEGTLVYNNQEEEPAEVYLELEAESKDGKIEGTFKTILSRHGDVFSNSTSNGSPDLVKKIEGSDKAIFYELGGKMGYFQLYFINGGKNLIGNFYHEKGMAEFEKKGEVRLTRK